MAIFHDFFNVHSSRKKEWAMSWRVGTRCVSSCKRLIVHKVRNINVFFTTDHQPTSCHNPDNPNREGSVTVRMKLPEYMRRRWQTQTCERQPNSHIVGFR